LSLEYLSDETLIESFHEAKRLQLDPAFIQLLLKEIHKRNLSTR